MARLLNRVQMTVSGTPGTGTITLGSATSGYQTPASAGVIDGELCSWLAVDGTAWELFLGFYTASGTTVARTTFRESSTGSAISLTSAAVISCVGLAEDYYATFIGRSDSGVFKQSQLTTGSAGVRTITANNIYALPWVNSIPQTLTKIGFAVTTLGAGNGRAGIYQDYNGQPGKLVVDGGSVSTGTTGDKEATISAAIKPGLYWLVFVADNATVVLRGNAAATGVLGLASSSVAPSNVGQRAFTYAALPADESGATYTFSSIATVPLIWVRN
jgi:hypothetical protein